MNVAATALRQSRAAALLAVALVVAGGISAVSLPSSIYPPLEFPRIVIIVKSGTLPPQSMMLTVTRPLEQAVLEVPGVRRVRSRSIRGAAEISAQFVPSTDMVVALQQVQNRVAIALPRVPADVRNIGITTVKNSPDLTMVVHLYSPDKSRDTLFISNFATLEIKDPLTRIEGVGSITVFGSRDYAMRIWLDPQKLQARGLLPSDVMDAINQQNRSVASGQLGIPPVASEQAFQYTLLTPGRIDEVAAFEQIIVKSSSDNGGRITRVRDVGWVEGLRHARSGAAHVDGHVLAGDGALERIAVLVTEIQQHQAHSVFQ